MANGWRSPRSWLALLLLVVAWFGLPHLEDALRGPPARWLHLHTVQNGVLVLGPFAWEMTVRLALDIGLFAAILMVLGVLSPASRSQTGEGLNGCRSGRRPD